MLFTSPRYSVLAQVNLMRLVECKTMLVPEGRLPVVDNILAEYEMRMLQIPEFDKLLAHTYPDFPFDKTFEDARNEPLVVLQTSGTTGLPRPIIWTHDWAASFGEQRLLTPPPGFESCDALLLKTRVLSLMPAAHVSRSDIKASRLITTRQCSTFMLILERLDICSTAFLFLFTVAP